MAHDPRDWHPDTLAAQALHRLQEDTGGVIPGWQPATTFARRSQDYDLTAPGYVYGRADNANVRLAEEIIAGLEGGQSCRLFPSGLAAIAALFRSLPAGSHVAVQDSGYFGTLKWLRDNAERLGLALSFFATGDLRALEAALRPGETALVWIETPANPLWTVTDIAAAADLAHGAGAVLAVDATVMTPVLCRPLGLGADLVFHSATKYLNGHSDVLAGALVTNTPGAALWQAVEVERHGSGPILGAFEAWLLVRGMRTVHLRVRQASAVAQVLAERLAAHPKVEVVRYPGLAGDPGHGVSARQMQGGFGGMLSFDVAGGAEAALRVVSRLRLIIPATSLGGVESLIEHRATVEGPHSDVPKGLLRLSVGVEDADDLWADLEQALSG
ncbi:MAG: PLP-dependent transferase [Alphaproteobacteria bacterium]|nr:PLP-dependent transferase [Alphaproteobacteria bacterium]